MPARMLYAPWKDDRFETPERAVKTVMNIKNKKQVPHTSANNLANLPIPSDDVRFDLWRYQITPNAINALGNVIPA